MATVGEISTRVSAEAPTCCGERMKDTNAGRNVGGPIAYRCGNCLTTAKGRRMEDIGDDIDKGRLTPPAPQERTPVNTGATATATEHNTAALKRILATIRDELHAGTDVVDRLASRCATLVAMVAEAGEFAVATEQTAQSKTALDEANSLATSMDQHLGGISAAVSAAEDAVNAALAALRAVDAAEDELHQSGAGPKSVAPARADA